MAKDRNTFAKRQREVEKKQKADQKRERRARRKQDSDDTGGPGMSPSALSRGERCVLNAFRKHLMTPGKLFCFEGSDLDTFDMPLAQLTRKGLLVAEEPEGGYSLTETGFTAMNDGD